MQCGFGTADFEQLKDEYRIADSCVRVVIVKQSAPLPLPDTEQGVKSELPDWVLS
jgi:hypothetical protein